MESLASLTTQAKEDLTRDDWSAFAGAMRENFRLRRAVYGEEALGRQNLRMIEIGERHGAACKFPGEVNRSYDSYNF